MHSDGQMVGVGFTYANFRGRDIFKSFRERYNLCYGIVLIPSLELILWRCMMTRWVLDTIHYVAE